MKKYSVVSDFQEITGRSKSLRCNIAQKTDICTRIISLPINQEEHSAMVRKIMIQQVGGWERSRNASFCTEPV